MLSLHERCRCHRIPETRRAAQREFDAMHRSGVPAIMSWRDDDHDRNFEFRCSMGLAVRIQSLENDGADLTCRTSFRFLTCLAAT